MSPFFLTINVFLRLHFSRCLETLHPLTQLTQTHSQYMHQAAFGTNLKKMGLNPRLGGGKKGKTTLSSSSTSTTSLNLLSPTAAVMISTATLFNPHSGAKRGDDKSKFQNGDDFKNASFSSDGFFPRNFSKRSKTQLAFTTQRRAKFQGSRTTHQSVNLRQRSMENLLFMRSQSMPEPTDDDEGAAKKS